jgi:nucleotide-binding universal stress UspA family protein
MYSEILVPLDGSHLSEQVLPYVRMLAGSFKLPVHLFQSYGPVSEELADPLHGRYLDAVSKSYRNDATDYLHGIGKTMEEVGVEVRCSVREGRPPNLIVDEAEKNPGTLIAMSTHGRSGVSRWLLGSITNKVLHATNAPLLVVRASEEDNAAPPSELTSIIVPLDGSTLAEESLSHVIGLARNMNLKVILVRVESDGEEVNNNYLHAIQDRLSDEGVASVEKRVLHGHPAVNIVDLAHDTAKSLVTMTTHGRSGIGRWVLGSVTDRVVRYSGDPVLVIRSSD